MIDHPGSWKGLRPLTGWRSIFTLRIPWGRVDWHVLLLAAAMVGTSLVFVHTMAESDIRFGREGISFPSHVKKVIVACPFLLFGFLLRPRWLRRNAWLIYLGIVVLLVLVPVIGEERNNARRWIPLPLGFDVQPSELAKLALIVILARVLWRNRLEYLSEWIWPAGLALVPMALVVAQPDLGTALTIVPITLGMCWLAGARAGTIAGIVLVGVALGALVFQLELVQSYQLKRIETWAACLEDRNLIESRNGAAFHTYQARVAIGNGGVRGTGLGKGVANEAGHLPERESDSIFAVIAEEGGLLGASALVFFYLLMSGFLLVSAGRVRDRFTRLVVGGVGLYFASHFFINASVNLGLVPMTGLTLPLISTGGSSLLTSFMALGLAVGLASRPERSLDLDSFRG